MLISYKWLSSYFKSDLPSPEKIAEAITMHAFEIESMKKHANDTIFDVKILPNRAHDCLSHHGIATEIAALFDTPMNAKRFEKYEKAEASAGIKIEIENAKLCPRYIARLIENISVGESQEWLKERIEAIGQRSINNIVDICNYVMFDIGQPMHAFDADKVKGPIAVRFAKSDEIITTLDSKEVVLNETVLVIADDEGPIAIAGIKGGKRAEVDGKTKRIILEAANFNSTAIRKTSQKIGIKTDASKRFENEITPSLAKAGIEYVTSLIVENANREAVIHESFEVYPRKQNPYKVGVSLSEINRLLGTDISEDEAGVILDRFGWEWELADPREKILALSNKFVGAPYRLGASVTYDAPREFDCSSLTSYLFAQAGIAIPRISIDQYVFGEPISQDEAEAGDLVFSNSEEGKIHYESIEWLKDQKVPEGIDHVGLLLGEGKVLHASRTSGSGSVGNETLSESKQFKNIVGFRRIPALEERRFIVTVPAVRLDLRLKEDVIEDIGRIYGFDKIPATLPEKPKNAAKINKLFYYSQKIRNILTSRGFDEVQTYAFLETGEIELENPLASDKKFLRSDLRAGLRKSLELNAHNAELLGLDEVKIFEIGTVFTKEEEEVRLGIGIRNIKKDKTKEDQKISTLLSALKIELEEDDINALVFDDIAEISLTFLKEVLPESLGYGNELAVPEIETKFHPISPYPFVLRDIAVWVPSEVSELELEAILIECSGPLLVHHRLFDTFTKEFDAGEKKTSYAFRFVFQSSEKTLSDDEVNEIMKRVNDKIGTRNGWEVR